MSGDVARRGHYRPFTLESGWLGPVGDVFGWTHLHKTSLINSLITSGTTSFAELHLISPNLL